MDDPLAVAVLMGPERLLGNPVTRQALILSASQRRAAILNAIDTIDDSTATRLAVTPPTPIDQAMQNVVTALDSTDQRGTNADTARLVLKAWVPELPTDTYAAWESALGI